MIVSGVWSQKRVLLMRMKMEKKLRGQQWMQPHHSLVNAIGHIGREQCVPECRWTWCGHCDAWSVTEWNIPCLDQVTKQSCQIIALAVFFICNNSNGYKYGKKNNTVLLFSSDKKQKQARKDTFMRERERETERASEGERDQAPGGTFLPRASHQAPPT